MNLQDHFNPPLSERRHWHAFHNAWATYLAASLNEWLPPGYFAEPNVQFGIEIDVAAFDETPLVPAGAPAATWSPPAPVQTIPFQLTSDIVEVTVYNSEAGPTLVGAIELVSPANKDRPSHRDAFTAKCATYLRQGIGLLIVDVVTERAANLHNELMAQFMAPNAPFLDAPLCATAYRPVGMNGESELEIWQESLAVGEPLPTLPLWLRSNLSVPVNLGTTYTRTCREQRLNAVT